MRRSFSFVLLLAFVALFLLPVAPSAAKGLADDGRIAVVTEVQGTALVRPTGRARWTPLGPKSRLFPGDLVRTDVRGAHLVELSLLSGGSLVIGPGTTFVLGRDGVHLHRGELEARGDGKATISVTGPGDYAAPVTGTAWLSARGRETRQLEKEPKWLTGYRASANDEWMGALVANIDGRDVPLAVGHHKVAVEIRDQIARTTVEQSFVNSTPTRLEGVFYFPLPADASISGFGMWIGGELVEADIVEKQRARQIYEDILKRKKDPGLLEWEGGNLFKARVFPIEPMAEKRIRVRYTQVLPLEGDTWRYRYALRSELLRAKPLRELAIDVRVVSAQEMVEVASPTHECRIDNTGHEARVEFTAREFRPENDFEVAVAVKGSNPLVVLPHRRGDDGYFMVQLQPPDEGGAGWQRTLTPEGGPLDLLLVADTSGSVDAAARSAQQAFLSALLGLLGEKDTFRLLACDSDAVWIEGERLPVREDTVARALDALGERVSLGWTDLDRAFSTALAEADANTTVVYVGDGIGTTGDADPIALADRLRVLGRTSGATVHAVSASSTYEMPVLTAMAEIGGGSVRRAGQDTAQTAFALLSEVARPVVKDLQVRVEGIRTARVYPIRLANLPIGHQQIVLGRFEPSDRAQEARVVVTGTLSGKPVRYAQKVRIPATDAGNSFLPRLWAREHISALMSEGATDEIKAEVISFSERFGVMTPYTSFLVLESDEDRERYGVERHVHMRDGERFFAEAGEKAMLEVRRRAMQQAGLWRAGLRREMLLEIKALGRDLPIAYPHYQGLEMQTETASGMAWGDAQNGPIGIGGGAGGSFRGRSGGRSSGSDEAKSEDGFDLGALREESERAESAPSSKPMAPKGSKELLAKNAEGAPSDAESIDDLDDLASDKDRKRSSDARGRRSLRDSFAESREDFGYAGYGWSPNRYTVGLAGRLSWPGPRPNPLTLGAVGFPGLPAAPEPDDEGTPDRADFDPQILGWLTSLWRRPVVEDGESGFHFVREGRAIHPTRGHMTGYDRTELWVNQAAWWRGDSGIASQPTESWVAGGKRGGLSAAFRLARTRDAEAADAGAWSFPLDTLGRHADFIHWASHSARIEARQGDVVTVVLRAATAPTNELWLVIDTVRAVLLERRTVVSGKVVVKVTYADHVQAAGAWWPTRIETRNDKDEVTHRATLSIESVAAKQVDVAVTGRLSSQADVVTIDGPMPKLTDAKQAAHERRDGFVDALVLALHYATTQEWDTTWEHWTRARGRIAGKPGADIIDSVFLQRSRRGEEFKAHLASLAERTLSTTGPNGAFLAPWTLGLASSVLGYNELLALLDGLAPVWHQPDLEGADVRLRSWQDAQLRMLAGANQQEAMRALRTAMAEQWPFDADLQIAYATDLWNTGRRDACLAHVRSVLAQREPWMGWERSRLYTAWTDRLWDRRDFDTLEAAIHVWLSFEPRESAAWQRYFSLLYLRGKTEDADRVLGEALAVRLLPDADPADWRRLDAAVTVALGQGWNFQINRVDERWWDPLEALAIDYARLETDQAVPTHRLMGDWRFRQTRAWREVQVTLREDLLSDGALEGMSLARLGAYLMWLPWARGQVDDAVWRAATDRVRARYEAATDTATRDVLATMVLNLLDQHSEPDEAIAFVRGRFEGADGHRRVAFARDLWGRIMTRPFGAEREVELIGLVSALIDPSETKDQQRSRMAAAMRQLADRIYTWHEDETLGKPEDRAALSRAEIKALRADARTAGREAVVSRFRAAQIDAPELARPWLKIERLGYAVEAGLSLSSVVAEADGILAQKWAPDGDPLDRNLRERAAVTLAYACTRRNAEPAWIEGTQKLLHLGVAAQDALLASDEDAIELLDWRYQIFRLFVALDRPSELESDLASWIVPAKVESRWRIALGYLLAELGRLDAAVQRFESAESVADALGAEDYRALADWYLVLERDQRREHALDRRYEKTDEWQLANMIRWTSRGSGQTSEVEPETLRILRVLMRKSSYPGNHVYRVRNLYRATKEFRVLESLADGVVGHSKEGIYGFLGSVSQVVAEIHEEATCDAIVERIGHRLDGELTALDRRGLSILIAMVEQRASLVLETDPTHEARGLDALRRAAQGTWAAGERRLMAQTLATMRYRQGSPFANEQVRQVDALLDQEPLDSADRVFIGQALGQVLWHQGRSDDAIDALLAALEIERDRTGGTWTSNADGPLGTLVNWYDSRRRYREAEGVLLAEMARRTLPARVEMLENQLFHLYANALQHGSAVGIGQGRDLYNGVRAQLLAIFDREPTRASALMGTFCHLHRAGMESKSVPEAATDLRTWSEASMPALLERLPLSAYQQVRVVADELRRLLGPSAGLKLLLDRCDAEPKWLARMDRDTWHQHASRMANWRYEAPGSLGDLEPRLWAVVETGLEENLVYGTNHGSWFWNRHNKWYWAARKNDFALVALRVLELHEDDAAIVMRVAVFQRGALGLTKAAVTTLLGANERGLLDVNGRFTLGDWLRNDKRFAEAEPIARALLAQRPEQLRLWILVTDVEAGLDRREAALATLKACEASFREERRWQESVAAQLGETAIRHRFSEHGLGLFEEAIELRTKAQGWKGGRDTRIAYYFRVVGEGRGQLGRIDGSLDAFSSALVAGHRAQGVTNDTLAALDRVLSAGDLDAWAARYAARVDESGLDATPFRKAFARAYVAKGEHGKAIEQLLAARDVDPLDAAIHRELVKSFDAIGDTDGAIDALFGSIRMAPQNVEAYADLDARYRARGRAAEAERALTTMVELTPHDAAGHRRLAQIREGRSEREAALVQWQQVARTRALEPEGLFGVARMQLALGQTDAARDTLGRILGTVWQDDDRQVKERAGKMLVSIK